MGTSTLVLECAIAARSRPPAEGPAATVLAGLGLTWSRWLEHCRPLFAERPVLTPERHPHQPCVARAHGGGARASRWPRAPGGSADEHVLLALAYDRTERPGPGPLEDGGRDADSRRRRAGGAGHRGIGAAAAGRLGGDPALGPRVYFSPDDGDAIIAGAVRGIPAGFRLLGVQLRQRQAALRRGRGRARRRGRGPPRRGRPRHGHGGAGASRSDRGR